MLSAHIFIQMPWPRRVFEQTELAMHRILHPSLFRSLAVVVVATHGVIMSGPAMAHWGHLADLAGHSHVAGALLGGVAAALAAGLIATRSKNSGAAIHDDDMSEQDTNGEAATTDDQQEGQAHA